MEGLHILLLFVGFLCGMALALWLVDSMGSQSERNDPVVTEIRVPARWHEGYAGNPRMGEAVFTLGVGPCGKNVDRLSCGWEEQGKNFVVSQWCGDEQRLFHYRREDITGRIVKTYDRLPAEIITP